MCAPGEVRFSRRPLWALAPLLWLAGCGFHMQGRIELPRSLASAHIEASDQQSDFYSSLHAALSAAGSQLDGPTADAATVRILEDSASERILTVSARNTPTAFVLVYRVKVAVEYQGRELLPAEEHTLSREYSFDETQLLAKQRESDILRQALADDLAALVMHRLAAL
jgi:LPS-assembly lipoprotein